MRIIENASLRHCNTFAVEARTRYLVYLESLQDIQTFVERRFGDMPRLFLGGGSNVLFRQDFPGVVGLIRWRGIEIVDQDEEAVYIRAAAGENWHDFVQHTLAMGYSGLENLALIPGTVGAAPMQNIGAYGVELRDRFESLEAFDLTTGRLQTFDNKACEFGYRHSFFKTTGRDRYVILTVTFKLPRKVRLVIDYPDLARDLDRYQGETLSARRIAETVGEIRRRKLPDPTEIGSAGSFFKNPVVAEGKVEQVRDRFPGLVAFPLDGGRAKLSAAWLIEQCGWKGYRMGDAGVYGNHALVLVNYGKARGTDIWRLAEAIIATVEERFGIRLEPEPLVV